MDSIDRNILVALQHDGAAGLAELAKVAGLSVSATAERVKRLEERSTNPWLAGGSRPRRGGLPAARLGLRGAPRRCAGPEVPRSGAAAGTGAGMPCRVRPLVLHAEAARRRAAELEAFVSQDIRRRGGVERTETVISILTAKETAMLPVAPPDDDEA